MSDSDNEVEHTNKKQKLVADESLSISTFSKCTVGYTDAGNLYKKILNAAQQV